MSATDGFRFAVLAVMAVFSGLAAVGVGSIILDGIRLYRRWRAMR
jgi:hypothetical protein